MHNPWCLNLVKAEITSQNEGNKPAETCFRLPAAFVLWDISRAGIEIPCSSNNNGSGKIRISLKTTMLKHIRTNTPRTLCDYPWEDTNNYLYHR